MLMLPLPIPPIGPERRLLAAIILRACRDARSVDQQLAADARRYLAGENFETDCFWLGLNPNRLRAGLATLPASRPGRMRPQVEEPTGAA